MELKKEHEKIPTKIVTFIQYRKSKKRKWNFMLCLILTVVAHVSIFFFQPRTDTTNSLG